MLMILAMLGRGATVIAGLYWAFPMRKSHRLTVIAGSGTMPKRSES
jgi:hypothetical protein